MGIFIKIIHVLELIKNILDFVNKKIQDIKRNKERKNLQDLSDKTEKYIKDENIEEINKNLL